MKNNCTELVFILDASGSMADFVDDTVGGFNAMLEKQKKVEGKALVSTVLFANDSRVIHDRVDLTEVEPLSDQDYRVGCKCVYNFFKSHIPDFSFCGFIDCICNQRHTN